MRRPRNQYLTPQRPSYLITLIILILAIVALAACVRIIQHHPVPAKPKPITFTI